MWRRQKEWGADRPISGGKMRLSYRLSCAVLAVILGSSVVSTQAETLAPPPKASIPDPSSWQQVITIQIEAFRKGDAETAMKYAGSMFRRRVTDPNLFMRSVAAAGYKPIFTSLSHSFGQFTQPDPRTALQVVLFIGARQQLYEAIYALQQEAGGWRVESLELMQLDGMAV
jgi:hypothetical protein